MSEERHVGRPPMPPGKRRTDRRGQQWVKLEGGGWQYVPVAERVKPRKNRRQLRLEVACTPAEMAGYAEAARRASADSVPQWARDTLRAAAAALINADIPTDGGVPGGLLDGQMQIEGLEQ